MTEVKNMKETNISTKSKGKGIKSRIQRSNNKRYFGSIKFNNISPDVFCNGQWPIKEFLFLLYKAVVAIYTVVVLICSIRGFDYAMSPRRAWPVWLTNWSYLLLTAYSICSFLIVAFNYVTKNKYPKQPVMKNPPTYIKITWALYSTSLPLTYLVTLVFFVALFPKKNLDFIPAGDLHTHLLNSVVATIEILIGALPIRVLHIAYPIIFGVAYSAFSVIYWLFDPVGNVIYQGILDWNEPAKTLGVIAFMNFVMAPIIQLIQYLLFKLRVKCHSLIFQNNYGEE